MSKGPFIAGLDLSLTNSGAVVCPLDWDGQWGRVEALHYGYSLPKEASEKDRIERCIRCAHELLQFLKRCNVREAWLESDAYSSRSQAHSLGQLGGVVRLYLYNAGIEIRTANMSSARKLLLGHVPAGTHVKSACRDALLAAGAPRGWDEDEVDAFVALNYGLSEHPGAYCFARGEHGE